MSAKPLVTCEEFLSDLARASAGLRRLVVSEIRHLRDRVRQAPKTWTRGYDRVAGMRGVVEVKVAGAPRMLVVVDEAIRFWRVGDHDIIARIRKAGLRPPPSDAWIPLPGWIATSPPEVFPPSEDGPLVPYGPELDSAWVYFLDTEQHELGSDFTYEILNALETSRPWTGIVAGGPGTGKTAVLVWLLDEMKDTIDDWGFAVRLVCSERMRDYIATSLGWDVSAIWRPSLIAARDADVVLIDDPASLSVLASELATTRSLGAATAAVVAVDPLQCTDDITDVDFENLTRRLDAEVRWLSSCYRQKSIVGNAAMRVAGAVADSSPYLDDRKQTEFRLSRQNLTAKANTLEFVNPSGFVVTRSEPDPMAIADHLARLMRLKQANKLWRHWPPVLTVVDRAATIPEPWRKSLSALGAEEISLDEFHLIKGLEYQHVVVLLVASTHRALQEGFEGSGRRAYADFRLLRIPYTRARDSLATFVVSDRHGEATAHVV